MRKRIPVVIAAPASRQVVEGALERRGCTLVSVAENAAELLIAVELEQPYLVILGDDLPGFDALMLVSDIRFMNPMGLVFVLGQDWSSADDADTAGAHSFLLQRAHAAFELDLEQEISELVKAVLADKRREFVDERSGEDRRMHRRPDPERRGLDWGRIQRAFNEAPPKH